MQRRVITIRGIVQGIGFRPFVYRLAHAMGLSGFVRNQSGEVLIEAEGDAAALDRFIECLRAQPPAPARIDTLTWTASTPTGASEFHITASDDRAPGSVFVSPDIATCAECLRELLDPTDRRHGYPFINCTHCGPRLTIVTAAPYDRPNTTMAGFEMCADCRAEYDDPRERRFHAQPIACPTCGPQLQFRVARPRQPCRDAHPKESGVGVNSNRETHLYRFVEAIRAGQIGALKGLGGYHLVCDARCAAAVAELRRRKHRYEKPLAVMVADVAAAEELCHVSTAERELLVSPARPIVLLPKKSPSIIAADVAPRNPCLGVMLPYTPLHHLLARAAAEVPLVMTSGNQSDEPIAYEDADALKRLGRIADVFLTHDRPIHVRCDDSVTRVVAGRETPIRRSRGYAPQPIALPFDCPRPVLAVGGQLKGTFALGRGRHAFLSHHLGDLDHYEAYRAFEKDVALYEQLFAVRPEILAHDNHPDYATTRWVRRRAEREGQRLIAVQHHHAHLASCLAEHGAHEPAIGVIFDGAGYGTDGAVWGGEFLIGGYAGFERAGHFRYVGLPGGDAAAREPWRMAAAHLADAGAACLSLEARQAPAAWGTVMQMLERGVQTPKTSSVGRLFDGVAALAGVRDRNTYEGQAAVELEWLATDTAECGAYPFEIAPATDGSPCLVDTRPLIAAVVGDAARGTTAAVIARRFHTTMVEIIVAMCTALRQQDPQAPVVLSGGVFLNALLAAETETRLTRAGFRVLRHRLVPPGDGGLCLGQLAIAANALT